MRSVIGLGGLDTHATCQPRATQPACIHARKQPAFAIIGFAGVSLSPSVSYAWLTACAIAGFANRLLKLIGLFVLRASLIGFGVGYAMHHASLYDSGDPYALYK